MFSEVAPEVVLQLLLACVNSVKSKGKDLLHFCLPLIASSALHTKLKLLFHFFIFASFYVFAAASPGLQPKQFDQEKQRAGVAHGETDPDLSTCRGESSSPLRSPLSYIVCD